MRERVLSSFVAGAIVGVIEVVAAASFAALVFANTGRLRDGVGLFIAGAAIALAFAAIVGGRRGIVAGVQDGPAAVLAVVAASLTARVGASGGHVFLTVVAAVGVTTVLIGAACLVLGGLGFGDVVRFVPFPVVGGFLAGTGWLLLKGGIAVAAGIPVAWRERAALFASGELERWLPAALFGVAIVVIVRVTRRPLAIPLALVAGLVVFAVAVVASGSSFEQAQRDGWLLGPFPSSTLWRPWAVHALANADWAAVVGQAGGIVTAVFVGVIAVLLNVSGIELLFRRDLDSNAELRLTGVINVLAGASGSTAGFHALDDTSLVARMGADARIAGLVGAVLALATLLVGASIIAAIPRALVGGLLAFLGVTFLVEWVVDARRTLPRLEHAVVLAILVAIMGWGLLTGVAVGLVLAVALFAVTYSATDVVRSATTGAVAHSKVERGSRERELLRTHGDAIEVLRLQGFVFFGTAKAVLDRVRSRVERPPPLRWLVLDLARVSGVDSSAIRTVARMSQLGVSNGFEVLLGGVAPAIVERLERGGVDGVTFARDVDEALERSEDALLASVGGPGTEHAPAWLPGDLRVAGLDRYVEPVTASPGQVLLRRGEPVRELYLLRSGRLSVQVARPDGTTMRLRTMLPGVVVGEVSLYLGDGASADVVADTACELLRIRRDELARLEREEPDVAARVHRWFATILAERLSDTLAALDADDD